MYNRGEILPRLEEVLEEKLKETERKMGELAAFKENLIYYRERPPKMRRKKRM